MIGVAARSQRDFIESQPMAEQALDGSDALGPDESRGICIEMICVVSGWML
jgi:hypothetical protein